MKGSLSTCAAVVATMALAMLLALPQQTKADLPIHCLHASVVGTWMFELGADDHKPGLRCGHKVPDTNKDHFTKEGFSLEVVEKYMVQLSDPNIAVDHKGNRGTWTMVYDEGFEIIIGGRLFFAFNKYVPKTPASLDKDDVKDYNSICDETLVGWFHRADNTHWGCYHGKKVGGDDQQRFREKLPPSGALQPRLREVYQDRVVAPQPTHPMQMVSDDKVLQDVMWEPDYSFIELQNAQEGATWRAGVHQPFVGKRMSEMMRLLGYRKRGSPSALLETRYKEAHKQRRRKKKKKGKRGHPKGLPRSFDWRKHQGHNWDSPVKNQGNCGSCYSMATMSVIEAQVRIKSEMKDKTLFSSQAVVSCSYYNQGCEGGYPYLVAKHGMDFGFVPEGCMPYTGADDKCKFRHAKDCPDPENPPRYFATNYSYIGGYYGACNEHDMMKKIYNTGPIMVAFDAPSSLFYYTGGVYTGAAPPMEGPRTKELRRWEKTNHAVVGVGWGEENGVKYWIIKNTWGGSWGENGYFRIRRGTDECGIESMAVSVDVKLPKQ